MKTTTVLAISFVMIWTDSLLAGDFPIASLSGPDGNTTLTTTIPDATRNCLLRIPNDIGIKIANGNSGLIIIDQGPSGPSIIRGGIQIGF